jgi:hypothetical protein
MDVEGVVHQARVYAGHLEKKRTSSVPSLNTGCSKEIDLI